MKNENTYWNLEPFKSPSEAGNLIREAKQDSDRKFQVVGKTREIKY